MAVYGVTVHVYRVMRFYGCYWISLQILRMLLAILFLVGQNLIISTAPFPVQDRMWAWHVSSVWAWHCRFLLLSIILLRCFSNDTFAVSWGGSYLLTHAVPILQRASDSVDLRADKLVTLSVERLVTVSVRWLGMREQLLSALRRAARDISS